MTIFEALKTDEVLAVLEKFDLSVEDIDPDIFQYGIGADGMDLPEEVSSVIRDTIEYSGDMTRAALEGTMNMASTKCGKVVVGTLAVTALGYGIKKGVAKYKEYKNSKDYLAKKIAKRRNPSPLGKFVRHVKLCWG